MVKGQSSIVDVAERLGIEVVSSFGSSRKCRCFMHEDHHPSMSIWPGTNTWYCFVCQEGGSVIDLVMKYKDIGFKEACRWLGRSADVKGERLAAFGGCERGKVGRFADVKGERGKVKGERLEGLLERAMGSNNEFCRALVQTGMMSREQVERSVKRYRLGCTRDGGVVFWQIDREQRVMEGKVMHYMANGHRSHDRKPVTVSWLMKYKMKDEDGKPLLPPTWRAGRCLFGEHLLAEYQERKDDVSVAVVESEKTAVICSELLGDGMIWLATGGMSNLSVEALRPLKGFKVIIFPDTDPEGKTYEQWSRIARQASKELSQPFYVSDILEQCASKEQKEKKVDIVDGLQVTG